MEFDFHKAMILCKLLSEILAKLKEFFVPLFSLFFEPAILKIINTLIKLLKGFPGGKRSRAEIDHSEVSQDLSEKLLYEVCNTLTLLFKYDTGCFIQVDTYESLSEPVADLLTLLKVSNFSDFVEKRLKSLIFEMDDRINDDATWVKLNYALLMRSRSEHWQTRLASLSVIEHLFEAMRERYLIVLNDTIPFLSELLEDEHE